MHLVSDAAPGAVLTDLDALTFRFEDLPRQLRRLVDEALAGHDLSRTQWRLLAYVLRQQGLTQTELARFLEVERATAGLAIDALEARSLVVRALNPGDRRVWRIMATDRARALLHAMRETVDEVYAQLYAGFSTVELQQLGQFLDRLARNIRA